MMKTNPGARYTRIIALILVIMGLTLTRQEARAQTTCETTEDGNWSTLTWSCGHLPTSADDVVINHLVSLDIPAEVNNLTIYAATGISGDLTADNDLTVNGNFTLYPAAFFYPDVSTLTFAGDSGDQTIGGGGSLEFYDLVIANSSSGWVILSDFVDVSRNVVINLGGKLSYIGEVLTVGNTLTNNGTLQITKAVNSTAEHQFPSTGSVDYKGIYITPSAGLGDVSITIEHLGAGESCTSNPTVIYARRCFTVSPGLPAGTTVRLWAHADEMIGFLEAELVPYHYAAPLWTALGSISTGNDFGSYHFAQGTTSAGGATDFILGDSTAPTALNLLSLTARSGSWSGQTAVLGLAVLLLAGIGAYLWRRQRA